MMLYNISFPDKLILRKIDEAVGGSFSLKERLRMGGIGSPRMFALDGSEEIHDLIRINQDRTQCNAELRKNGIIIRFRSLLDTYALVIPYHLLSFYQNAERWQFHCGGEYITAVPSTNAKSNRKFLIKLMEQKALTQAGPNG